MKTNHFLKKQKAFMLAGYVNLVIFIRQERQMFATPCQNLSESVV